MTTLSTGIILIVTSFTTRSASILETVTSIGASNMAIPLKKNIQNKPVVVNEKTCPICNKKFIAKVSNAKYCCNKCKNKAANSNRGSADLKRDNIRLHDEVERLKDTIRRMQVVYNKMKTNVLLITGNEKGWF